MIDPAHEHPIFISHSSRDREAANRLVRDLERRGIPCWISSRDIRPGEDYQGAIVAALEAAPAMLLLFSTNANNSREILRELSLASTRRKPMIPVRLEDIVPSGAMEHQLTNAQFIDLFQNYNDAMERLCDALRRQMSIVDEPGATPRTAGPYARIPRAKKGRQAILLAGVATAAVAVAAIVGVVAPHHQTTNRPATAMSVPLEPAPESRTPPVSALHPQQIMQQPALPPAATKAASPLAPATTRAPVPAAVQTPPQVQPSGAASIQLPQPAPTPQTPSAPAVPQPAQGDAGSGALVRVVQTLHATPPNMRQSAVENAFGTHTEKLSGDQLIYVIEGTEDNLRNNLVRALVGRTQSPLTVPQAIAVLNMTGFSRLGTIQTLAPLLPTALSGPDLVALIERTSGNERTNAVRALLPNAPGPLDMASAMEILRSTQDNYLATLQELASILPHPVRPSDIQMLLGRTEGNIRANAVNALMAAAPDVIPVDVALGLLEGSDNAWLNILQLIAPHLPDTLSIPEFTALLGRTTDNVRVNAMNTIAGHLPNTVMGTDIAPSMHSLMQGWLAGLQIIAPHLASPQDAPSIKALLGDVTNNERVNAIRALNDVIPDQIPVDETVIILRNTGPSRLGAIQEIAGHCRNYSDADRDRLLDRLSPNERANALQALSR